ncbi:hypothetical protein NEOLI_000599 [Neolecta irregularis DAH-3]|uniref:Uncharacterized protein n=1 Tax=Neolecta irregularis (strain DAH-3) TaxID=1198029 RepID=A0A1U7LR53_NEOID|nr:hypothetical protein NEOLI_000599 [Neolecta irregularis DAH-3]|eukprot:OLL25145.1 hypothetical protein NEOLI_000599 [Neolecta irregularis DAH-3]
MFRSPSLRTAVPRLPTACQCAHRRQLRFTSSHAHSAKQSSDMPWLIGSAIFAAAGVGYLLRPQSSSSNKHSTSHAKDKIGEVVREQHHQTSSGDETATDLATQTENEEKSEPTDGEESTSDEENDEPEKSTSDDHQHTDTKNSEKQGGLSNDMYQPFCKDTNINRTNIKKEGGKVEVSPGVQNPQKEFGTIEAEDRKDEHKDEK